MATKREQYTAALRKAAATLNTDPAQTKDYVAIAEEYIAEAEHQDGTGYWAQFASAELVIEDFRLYVIHAGEYGEPDGRHDEDRWDCEYPGCGAKNQKVVARGVAGRADPTEWLRLECGHILV